MRSSTAYAEREGGGFSSAARRVCEGLALHPNATLDVGQVVFGQTCTISLDILRQFVGRKGATPKKWIVVAGDAEGGGIVPFAYRRKGATSALQFAIGLELMLLSPDPWRVLLTTDHPNGGPFTAYPRLIHLLMDKEERDREIAATHAVVAERSTLPSIEREYSLAEMAIMTRAAPARLLGLSDRGHLGPGARADIAVYRDARNRTAMFSHARLVMKDGRVVVEDGTVVDAAPGVTLGLTLEADAGMARRVDAAMASRFGAGLDAFSVDPAAFPRAGRLPDAAMPDLILNGIPVEDTFAEAFDMAATAIVVTADTDHWAKVAATTMTGFATSVIGCGVEAGIDRDAPGKRDAGRASRRPHPALRLRAEGSRPAARQTGRPMRADEPGLGLLRRRRRRAAAEARRPSCASSATASQIAKRIGGRRLWRIPVMDGEFVCEHDTGSVDGAVGGGNLLFLGRTQAGTARGRRGGGGGGAGGRRRHPAVSGRHRALGLEGRRAHQGPDGLDQRRLLPDPQGTAARRCRPRCGCVLEIVIDG